MTKTVSRILCLTLCLTLALLPLAAMSQAASEQDASPEALAPANALERGDQAWERRQEGQKDGRAASGPITEAVEAYEEALAAEPESLEVIWKLLRALHFQGDYTTDDRDEKKAIYGRGREVSEAALNLLSRSVGGRDKLDAMVPAAFPAKFEEPEVARIYFWAAANWGLWGQSYGKMAAARQGVAERVRDYAEIVIALAPEYENGGAHRVLGRLHTEAPRIPFVTGWIDHDKAVDLLRKALEFGPDNPYNRFFLADAERRFDKKKRSQAMEEIRALAELEPRPDKMVEDLSVREDARQVLEDR